MKRNLAFALILALVFSVSVSAFATTFGEENALRSAQAYLEFSAFSYKGLIRQLEYEGYAKTEAIYAALTCGANWNEQAFKSAQAYLSFMSFSYDGLVDQLEYEGFTAEQAAYGATKAYYGKDAVKQTESAEKSSGSAANSGGGVKNSNDGLYPWSTEYLESRYPGVRQKGDGCRENFSHIIKEGNLPLTADELYVILAEIETKEAIFRCLDRWIALRNN